MADSNEDEASSNEDKAASNKDEPASNEDEINRITDILKNLKTIADKIRTEPTSCCERVKNKLKENGYDWFGEEDPNKETKNTQVMRVFATAVNDAMRKKVDLADFLKELLEIDKVDNSQSLTSPLALAKQINKRTPQWRVQNLIQYQFDTRWNTKTGEPDNYTFYEFCDSENTTDFLKYKPRQAHVKATLYKECRKKDVDTLRAITKEQLCPKVYIKTTTGWKTWQADNPKTFEDANELWQADNPDTSGNANELGWMDKSIQNFIAENADEQIDDDRLIRSLSKPTLYWAVLRDSDFTSGDKLKLNKIGQTQVYVGKASNGIKGRWCEDGDNHCEMMSECLRHVCNMTTYDPSRLHGTALVDARLTLAKVRKEETALFVIKTFGGDEVEKAEIAEREAETECDEAEEEYEIANEEYERANEEFEIDSKKKLRSRELTNIEKAKNDALSAKNKALQIFQRCKEKRNKASEVTNKLKKRNQKDLADAETRHRKGIKIQNKRHNVIPSNKCAEWTPKNMAFGMNKN